MARPSDWVQTVNGVMEAGELDPIRTSIQRGRPYGSPMWVSQIADRLGLSFTLRRRGRPAKDQIGK